MAIFTVTNALQSGEGSFADAVAKAEALAGADTINFAAGITGVTTNGTITLSTDITIDGDRDNDGTADVVISADQLGTGFGTHMLFRVEASANIRFDGLIFSRGQGQASSSADTGPKAGAILNFGTVSITNSEFNGNIAYGGDAPPGSPGTFGPDGQTGGQGNEGGSAAGAIYNVGNLSVTNTDFTGNSGIGGDGSTGGTGLNGDFTGYNGSYGGMGGRGGAAAGNILNAAGGAVTLDDTSFSGSRVDPGRGGNGGDGAPYSGNYVGGGGGNGGTQGDAGAILLSYGAISGSFIDAGANTITQIPLSSGGQGGNSDRGQYGPTGASGVYGMTSFSLRVGTDENDVHNGLNGREAIFGLGGNDTLNGRIGNDFISGGFGNDTIDGGAGNDDTVGEDGDDIFKLSTGDDTFDGGVGSDTVDLTAAGATAAFLDLGSNATQVLPLGTLRLLSVTTENAIGTAGGDTLRGNALSNGLHGRVGNDTLYGFGGVDTLDGGPGVDTMLGGAESDQYYVDNVGDVVVEGAGEGTADRVLASISYTLGAGQEIEILTTTNTAGTATIHLTGNAFAQTLHGNAGFNILDGKGGADTMTGFAGNDHYYVDNAGDTVTEGAGEGTVDRVLTSISYMLGAAAQIEIFTTTNVAGVAALNLTGNSFAQQIGGNAGANIIDGRGGADIMSGVGGNDTYYVDNVGDFINEGAGQGTADRVLTSVSYTLAAAAQVELFTSTNTAGTGTLNLTGNGFAQTMHGNAGNNILDGKGGADTMHGFAGNDWFYVDNTGDVVLDGVGQGTADRVFASASIVLTAGAEIEILSTTNAAGTTAINFTGNGFSQSIGGNNGANSLFGGGGDDAMVGFGGDDHYFVDSTGDSVIEQVGGGANDRVSTSISYTLTSGQEIELFTTTNNAGVDSINLTGNNLAQTIGGNAGANILSGKEGNDILNGFGGADIFVFDTALGAGNVDTIQNYIVADDTIRLENAIFTGLAAGALSAGAFNTGVAATQADDRIVYNSATGALLFDADGLGGAAGVQFATLGGGLGMTGADFFVV